ncbi:MAG TPA: EpsI family protein [Vicinamibacterales bacterium]
MKPPIVRALALCALMIAASVFLANARKTETPVSRQSFSEFPMLMGGWKAVNDPPLEPEILKVLGVDDYLSRVYYPPKGTDRVAGLYMGFYGSQRQGDTIHSPQNCLPGSGWEPISEGRLTLDNVDGAGRSVTVNRYVIQKGLERMMVLYWYHGRGRVVASEYASRALLIRDAIVTNRTDGSLVRVIVPIASQDGTNLQLAEDVAQEFVRVIFPSLGAYLP